MSAVAPVRAEGLTKDYGGGNGLFDLDLEVERGEVLGFLGPTSPRGRRSPSPSRSSRSGPGSGSSPASPWPAAGSGSAT
jgi:ABC-type phosphonate transport system ATPase subunit